MMNRKQLLPKGQTPWGVESEAAERVWKASSPTSVCSRCGGAERFKLTVPYGDPSFGKSIPCSCLEQRQASLRRQQIREAAHMEAYRGSTFQTFNASMPGIQDAYLASHNYAANPRGWLLLVGPCGSGKTHLAAAIANQRLESGATVYFTNVSDLLNALRSSFASPGQYTHLFGWVREVELLVLDDLGAHQPTRWSTEKLQQLLEYRALLALSIVITALPNEIVRLDRRIRSRLANARLVKRIDIEKTVDFRSRKVPV